MDVDSRGSCQAGGPVDGAWVPCHEVSGMPDHIVAAPAAYFCGPTCRPRRPHSRLHRPDGLVRPQRPCAVAVRGGTRRKFCSLQLRSGPWNSYEMPVNRSADHALGRFQTAHYDEISRPHWATHGALPMCPGPL